MHLFLDIDGVLLPFGERLDHDRFPEGPSRILQQILDIQEWKVVISSTWRYIHSEEEIAGFLEASGVTGANIVGSTGDEVITERWKAILDYCEAHAIDPATIVILDDLAMAYLGERHSRTSETIGLTEENLREVETIISPDYQGEFFTRTNQLPQG